MKIFVLDNYDSFTYNLVHILEKYASVVNVKRNDQVSLAEIKNYDKIVFSPGPGKPSDVKIMHEIIAEYKKSKSILGVCLGHQSIVEFFGGRLRNMPEVNHGREFETIILAEDYIYNNIPESFYSGRYHSWIADKDHFPKELRITAIDRSNQIMSLMHMKYDIRGVQYHPESIMTEYGGKILENWVLN
jgi:anthranilate synthase component 2